MPVALTLRHAPRAITETGNTGKACGKANLPTYTYKSTYSTACSVAKIVSSIGWIAVGIGALFLFVSISKMDSQSGNIGILALLPALGCIASGLITVAIGQMARAAVDTADHTGEMLAIVRTTASVLPVEGSPLSSGVESGTRAEIGEHSG